MMDVETRIRLRRADVARAAAGALGVDAVDTFEALLAFAIADREDELGRALCAAVGDSAIYADLAERDVLRALDVAATLAEELVRVDRPEAAVAELLTMIEALSYVIDRQNRDAARRRELTLDQAARSAKDRCGRIRRKGAGRGP